MATGDWVETQLAATEQLIAQSHQAVGRVSARIQQTHRRVQRTSRARALHRLAAEELADYQVWIAAAKDRLARRPEDRLSLPPVRPVQV